jgi:peptidoglycan/xylan/chitin deacetylase (PgdA/CDA1 family)
VARRRGRHLRLRVVEFLAVVLLAGAFPLVSPPAGLFDLAPPVDITIRGTPAYVEPGTTFREVVARFHVAARSGSLTDVEGKALEAGKYPGRIELNGHAIDGDPVLRDGDAITVINGKNRTEPTFEQVVDLPGGVPGNPEFFLGTQPGRQIITRGTLSGKLVSSVFQPTGPVDRPDAVALTFDDGPWPVTTEAILAVLEKYHVKATFFVIGFQAAARPELIRAEVAAGMTVANHSWDHPNSPPFRDLGEDRIHDEIVQNHQLLASLGAASTLFRPPGGSYSSAMIEQARALGDRIVLWSVDPKDWAAGATPKQIRLAVLDNVQAGSIVVLHDGGGDRSATVKALGGIIKGIRNRGLDLVALEP